MEDWSYRLVRTLVTRKARRGLSASEIACALISMMARSTCSNQRPDAAAYIRVKPARRWQPKVTSGLPLKADF